MSKASWISASTIFLLVAMGCASNANSDSSGKSALGEKLVTRVYTDVTCPEQPTQEALAEILAGLFLKPLLETTVKGIGDAIKKAGEDQVTTRNAKSISHFYSVALGSGAQDATKVDIDIGCVTVVHGRLFDPRTPADTKEKQARDFAERFSVQPADVGRYLSPAEPNGGTREYTDDVRFFAQYALNLSDDNTAMYLEPITVLVGEPFKTPKRSAKGSRDIVLVLSMKLPSQNGGDDAFAVATSKYIKTKSNTRLSGVEVEDGRSGWMPLAPIPKSISVRIAANAKRRVDLQSLSDAANNYERLAAAEEDSAKKKELLAKKAAADISRKRLSKLITQDEEEISRVSPVTIEATLVETQKGNEFLVNLGSFISGKSSDIAQPIFDAIDPATKDKAASAELDNEDALRIAAIEAVGNFDSEDAKATPERDEVKIRIAKIKAEQACRKLRAAGHDDVSCVGF